MKRRNLLTILILSVTMLWGLFAIVKVESVRANRNQQSQVPDDSSANQREAVQLAVTWLVRTHQNDDGGYTSFSTGANQAASDVGGTLDAVLAISSAGYNPAAAAPDKAATPIDFLSQNRGQMVEYASLNGAQAGKVVLALVAANQNPRSFAGNDFVAVLTNHLNFSGQYNVETAFEQSLAILALRAVHEPVPESAVDWLLGQQSQETGLEGSWDDGFGTSGNADATAMSVMALASTQLTTTQTNLAQAADFLQRTKLASGGWEYGAGFGPSVNSTALVVQALSALGSDLAAPGEHGLSPLSALLAWQGESGAFQADFGDGPFDDFYATVQALPAAAGRAFPLPGHFQAALRAVDCLATLQDPVSGGWEQFATFGVDAAGTSRAIQAIAAAGDNPASARWSVGGIVSVEALETLAPDYLANSRGGGVGIVIQGVVAAGRNANDFAGTDLVLLMSEHLSPTGEYDDTAFGPFSHAEAMQGLLAVGAEVDPLAVDWLVNAHIEGDWGGADSTGLALNVLSQLGISVPEAITVLHQTQAADGGWGFDQTNPSSTSEVVQGLVAAGENPFSPAWSQMVSGTLSHAADAVLSLQAENGCWPNLFGPGDDPFSTTDAIMLLSQQPGWGQDLEVQAAVAVEPGQATGETTTSQSSETGEAPQPTSEPTQEPGMVSAPEATAMPEVMEAATAEAVAEAQPDPITEETAPAETAPEPSPSWALIIGAGIVVLLLLAGLIFRARRNR